MSILSPIAEGVMSLLFLSPSVNTVPAKYIELTKTNMTTVNVKSSDDAWITVGLTMRGVAKSEIKTLPSIEKQKLEKLL